MNNEKIYYIISSLRSLFFQMTFTVTAIYYIMYANLNPLEMVLVGTILEGTVFIFETPTGYLADRVSRKLSVCIGILIIGLAFTIQSMFPNFIIIALVQIFWGLGWTFISGAESAWIADETENQKLDEVFMNGAKYSSIGSFIGIIISIFISLNISIKITLLLAGICLVFLSIWSIFNMKEKNFQPLTNKSGIKSNCFFSALGSGIKKVKYNNLLLLIAFITLFLGLSSEGFDRLWEMHLLKGFNLSEIQSIYVVGILYAISHLLNTLLIKLMENKLNKSMNKLLLIINVFLIISILIFSISSNFLLAAVMYIISSSLRLINSTLFNIIINQNLESEGRATILSQFGQLDAVGQIAGGPITGIAANSFGISAGIGFTAILLMPVLILVHKLKNWEIDRGMSY